MSAESDVAELSSLRQQLLEVTGRVVQVADRYRTSSDSAVTNDLDNAERALITAGRALDRSRGTLEDIARRARRAG